MPPAAGISESLALCLTAATVGAMHTLLGPDHYVPFVALSRSGGWSLGKTLRVTAACGLAHVAGSVVIGLAGLALGLAVMRLETFEAFRGDVAAWLMMGFGLAAMTWGVRRAASTTGVTASPAWSPWLLFLVFAFGPCEPLIPLLMYPAAKASWWMAAVVAMVFTATTIATMSAVVVVLQSGVSFLPAQGQQRYAHAFAGAAILACGVLITLGL